MRGDSWKMQAANDIEAAMTMAGSKNEFISIMASADYGVKWVDSHKYITYTCPNGMKVRDNKLYENKFLKENMTYELNAREQQSGTDNEQFYGGASQEEPNNHSENGGYSVLPNDICHQERPLGCDDSASEGYGALPLGNVGYVGNPADEDESYRAEHTDLGSGQRLGGQNDQHYN